MHFEANTKGQNIHSIPCSHHHRGDPEEDPKKTKRDEIIPEMEPKRGSKSAM